MNKLANERRFGVYILDENGVCVRCFNSKKAAWGWMDKHHPELTQDEKRKRIWTFGSRQQVLKFWNKQIALGCSDMDVLGCLTYYCGAATSRGIDLKAGRVIPREAM